MSSKKKWFGLAALAALLVAVVKRKKRDEHGNPIDGSIET